MKNVFANHLFVKLGLFISTYAISQANLLAASAKTTRFAAIWPAQGQSPLGKISDDPEKPFYTDANDFNLDLRPSTQDAKQQGAIWEQEAGTSALAQDNSPFRPQVLFSLDHSVTPQTYEEESLMIPEGKTHQHVDDVSWDEDTFSLDPFSTHAPVADNYSWEHSDEQSAPHVQVNAVQPIPEEDSLPEELLYLNNISPSDTRTKAVAPPSPAAAAPPERIYREAPKSPPLPRAAVAQTAPTAPKAPVTPSAPTQATPSEENALPPKTILINFNNVGMIEYIRFISRISNKNFIFDEADLQFNVTIISEEPTSIENIMMALIQELRIHDLTLIEQGNNLIIHKNPKVNAVSKVVADDLSDLNPDRADIVTQVFRLNTLDPDRAAAIIRPLVSSNALVEVIKPTNHIIVTDIVTNVQQIGKLLKSLDAPNNGLVIGQYVARTAGIDVLMPLVQRIMAPISHDQTLIYVPYEQANSIFIVSSPFLVERSISILQHLDQEKGKTRIIELGQLKFEQGKGAGAAGAGAGAPAAQPTAPKAVAQPTGWDFGPSRTEYYEKQAEEKAKPAPAPQPPSEHLAIYPMFIPVEIPVKVEVPVPIPPPPETPAEKEAKERYLSAPPPPSRVGLTEFREEEVIPVEKISRRVQTNENYIAKPVLQTKFYIHKLQYRKGDAVQAQLLQIAQSMLNTKGHDNLLNTINTVQYLQDSKALVFTGTPDNIEKVRELVEQIDIPLREVYIEMLILNTTVDDALHYGVNWGNRFGGGHQAGSQGFQVGVSPLQGVLDSASVTGLDAPIPNASTFVGPPPFNNAIMPDPSNLAKTVSGNFSLGIIGQHIIHKGLGLEFNSIGALVNAIHSRTDMKVVMNPKIIAEDNVPAYIFVGITTPFQTQSVANAFGNTITNNFDYRDVGTSLQVTPHIMNSDMITLEILEEVSSISTPVTTGQTSTTVIAPTTSKNTTRTTVHVPNGNFVILSGMIEDDYTYTRTQIPCLGSIPLLGGGFSDKNNTDTKRNLMIFIRPIIVDTDEEYQNLTRHQQDIWEFKEKLPKMWIQETDQALDYFNVRRTWNTDDEDLPDCNQFGH